MAASASSHLFNSQMSIGVVGADSDHALLDLCGRGPSVVTCDEQGDGMGSGTPEEQAREIIDAKLDQAGWVVQSRDELDLSAGPGIAIREFPLKEGFGQADYLLYVDRKAIGVVEAKPEGHTLSGVEPQSACYSEGLPDNLPAYHVPLPMLYESTGIETQFTNGLDPEPRSRDIFQFHRPETLLEYVQADAQLRAGLRDMPTLDESGLWAA